MTNGIELFPNFLRDKRILVTGAASGIGLGSARLFHDLGARLVVADRNEEMLRATWSNLDPRHCVAVDVVDEAGCEAMVDKTCDVLGGLDGVFNSAGISDVVQRALDLDISDWQRVVDVNLRGTFLVCRSAGRIMVNQGYGSIVTVSSVNGVSGIPRRHAYGPAKAAIAQLTRTLACEWGSSSVRVNSLAPTYIRTPMIEQLSAAGKVDIQRLEQRTPLGRLGEVAEVGTAAAFLLSDWSRFLTGILLPVDGGWLAYGGPGEIDTA